MYVHPEKKLIYTAYPRTASNSTAQALMELGFEMVGQKGHHVPFSAKPLRKYGEPVVREEWTIFTTIRNHWDIAASFAWDRDSQEPLTLERIKTHIRPCWYIGEHDMFKFHTKDADVIIRYERVQDGLDFVLAEYGLGPVALPHIPTGRDRGGKHYREYYTPKTREYIYRRFQEEIEEYGYEF